MKRTAIARKLPPRRPERQWTGETPGMEPRRATMANPGQAHPVPKDNPARSEAYRRLVAARPCEHCKRPGPSQAAHADEGKGLGIKSDDRTCYALCADSPGRRGCHWVIGTSGALPRGVKRGLEARYGAKTRAEIVAAGTWPKGLELWSK